MSILARAVAVTALALLAACGSSGGAPPTPAAGLAGAMSSVSGSGPAADAFGYTDLARLRALGVVDARTHRIDDRWQTAASVGYRTIAHVVAELPRITGVDLTNADRSITIGDGGRAVRIDGGIDIADVRGRIKRLGPSDRTFGATDGYSFAGDDMVDGESAIGAQLPVGNSLDQIVVQDFSFAGSSDGGALQSILGGSPSLLDSARYRDIAHCLGDVVAAVVWTPRHDQNSALLAAGVRDFASLHQTHDEVVCAIPAPGHAADVRVAFAHNLSVQAVDPRFLIPVSKYATASHVDSVGPSVRVTLRVKPSAEVGFIIEAYFDGAAAQWDGSL